MATNVELFSALFDRVVDLTQARLIQWRIEDTGEAQFSADFAHSSLTLKIDSNSDPYDYVLELYNGEGNVVAYFSGEENFNDYNQHVAHIPRDARPLYEMVVTQVYRPVETAHELLDELDKLSQNAAISQ